MRRPAAAGIHDLDNYRDGPSQKIRSMKRLTIAAAFSLMATQFAFAQTTDVASITCADLADLPADAVSILLTWIDGYMGGQADDTSFDLDRLQANIDSAAEICGQNPAVTLMDALSNAENG